MKYLNLHEEPSSVSVRIEGDNGAFYRDTETFEGHQGMVINKLIDMIEDLEFRIMLLEDRDD